MKLVHLDELPLEAVSHPPAPAGAAPRLAPGAIAQPAPRTIAKKVLLRSGEVPHLTNFSQAYLAPGQSAAAHAHSDMAEVFFVTEGSGTLTLNSQPIALELGTCLVVEPGEVHEVRNTGDRPLVLTYFGISI